jgi:hypothetical protein
MAAETVAVPHLIQELSPDQFGLWRRHPVTELVLDQWIDDFLATMETGIMQAWLAGTLSLQVEQDARGYIHSLRHLQRLKLADLCAFWGVQPEDQDRDRRRADSGTGYS